jgi:hypothetical protein
MTWISCKQKLKNRLLKKEREKMAHKFTDENGINWQEFTCSYTHPIDGQTFAFTIWAVDAADAAERLKYIGEIGKVDGALAGEIEWKK